MATSKKAVKTRKPRTAKPKEPTLLEMVEKIEKNCIDQIASFEKQVKLGKEALDEVRALKIEVVSGKVPPAAELHLKELIGRII